MMKKTSIFRMNLNVFSIIENSKSLPTLAAIIVFALITLFVTSAKAQSIQSSQFTSQISETSQVPGFRLLSFDEELLIGSLDPNECDLKSKEVFASYTYSDFRKKDINFSSSKTAEIIVNMQEMVEDMTFREIFTALSDGNLEKIVLTPLQISSFCDNYFIRLRGGDGATFFLTKIGQDYVVQSIEILSYGLNVNFFSLDNTTEWFGSNCHDKSFGSYYNYVVTPKIIKDSDLFIHNSYSAVIQ